MQVADCGQKAGGRVPTTSRGQEVGAGSSRVLGCPKAPSEQRLGTTSTWDATGTHLFSTAAICWLQAPKGGKKKLGVPKIGSWGATELLDCLLRSVATAHQRQVCRKGSKASLR